ncbi:syntaxin-binding protein 4-like isoform X2 [Amphiura filiformis]|uniref:syntaxin-binding protein 4-like isoform X2 n=1 Tax=Amphiura filiformis TaxID=82378 RepID=UPI003B215F6F
MSETLTVMANGVGVVEGSPVHSEHMDETLTIVFNNCNTGLGIKIVGGKSDENIHKDYGIFVRRVIPGGLASREGRLREGDQILSVNGESLLRVSNERAVQLLRSASATNRVTLVVTRNPSAMRRFSELLDSQLAGLDSSRGSSSSGSSSPTGSQSSFASSQHGQYMPSNQAWSTSPHLGPRATSPAYSDSSSTLSSHHAQQSLPRLPNMQELSIAKIAGLGISIQGGSNSPDGAAVCISHIVPEGDCHRDGRLKAGDELIAIDGISMVGLTHEAAKAVLTRTRLRTDTDSVHIAYIPQQYTHSPNVQAANTGTNRPHPSHPYASSSVMGGRARSTSPSTQATSNLQQENKQHLQPTRTTPSPYQHHGMPTNPHPSSSLSPIHPNISAGRVSSPAYAQQGDNYNQRVLSGGETYQMPLTSGGGLPGGGGIPGGYQGMVLQPPAMSSTPQDGHTAARHQVMFLQPPTMSSTPLNGHTSAKHQEMLQPPMMSSTPQDGHTAARHHAMLLQPPAMSSTLKYGHTSAYAMTDDLRRLVLTQGQPAGISPVVANNSAGLMMGTNLQHTEQSSRQSSPSPVPRSISPGRRLSLDPHVRLKIDKLEVALRYLGITPNEEQKIAIRNRLHVDHSGTVPYGEFVAVAKELFKMQLDESHLSNSGGKSYDVTDFADPPPFQPQVYEPAPINMGASEVDRLRQERDDALRQVDKMKIMLQEKERSCNIAEEELLRIRKEAQGAIHESRALKSRVHLAEAAQKEARSMEVDYEEAMKLLEDEIVELTHKLKVAQQAKSPEVSRSGSPTDLQRRLAVLGSEVRKAEISKRTYEVATQRLLQFAELVHEVMTDGPNATIASARGRGEASRRQPDGSGSRPPGYLAKHGKPGPVNLANESRDTVRAVKALIEVEPLPYGWEEAYTKDGMKYYINHVTQCTSWIHPVSNINHLPEGPAQHVPKESRT